MFFYHIGSLFCINGMKNKTSNVLHGFGLVSKKKYS